MALHPALLLSAADFQESSHYWSVCLMHCWLLQRRSPTSHKEAGGGAGGLVNEARAAAPLAAAAAPGAVVSLHQLVCALLLQHG